MRRRDISPERPLTIAHRAANHIDLLRAAEEAGVDLVEADIRPWKGRIEVRHLKTMGPIPLLWDRWKLSPGWTLRFQLEDLLAEVGPDTELMLDIKPGDESLPQRAAELVREHLPGREYTVSGQNWDLLDHFTREPGVRVIYSVGNGRLLREVVDHVREVGAEAIGVHRRLLTPETVKQLREVVPLLVSWPINTDTHLRQLQEWGVNGIISDSLPLLRTLVNERLELEAAER